LQAWNFIRTLKKKNQSEFEIIVFSVGPILTPLYLGNSKSHKKYISILNKETFIWSINKKLHQNLLKNAPHTKKIHNTLSDTFGPLISFVYI